ncbi:hypothetical protein GALL_499920 [mine drainage metagenome]|jgi:hypothetical protein|uniref:Uncharacterized protein n=1 Tax=mine drainage metagenome TaxID=410659 RepID=A0A1J5PCD0_9ZZZZ
MQSFISESMNPDISINLARQCCYLNGLCILMRGSNLAKRPL